MANKATKSLAKANAVKLKRTHLTTLTLHALFVLYRLLLRHGSWKKYLLLSAPSLAIELYLERIGRPRYAGAEIRSPGEDLEGAGLMECLWDMVYVGWILIVVVAVLGEWAWWGWCIIPLYGTYLALTTFNGMRQGLMPGVPNTGGEEEVLSKRQQKRVGKAKGN